MEPKSSIGGAEEASWRCPAIFMTAMPKNARAYLSNTLKQGLGLTRPPYNGFGGDGYPDNQLISKTCSHPKEPPDRFRRPETAGDRQASHFRPGHADYWRQELTPYRRYGR